MVGVRGRPLSEPSASVILRGLPQHITEADIRETLAHHQTPYKQVKLPKDNRTLTSKGYAFVDFDSVQQAQHFISNSPYGFAIFVIKGNSIDLDFSKPPSGSAGGAMRNAADGDWMCGYCNAHNFSKRTACFVCKVPKDEKSVSVARSYHAPARGSGSSLNPVALVSGSTSVFHSQPAAVIQVSGLDAFTDQDTVRYSFSPFGVVRDVRIIFDNETGKSTGISYVEFASVSEASAAMSAYKRTVSSGTPFVIDKASVTLEYYTAANNAPTQSNSFADQYQYMSWQAQSYAQAQSPYVQAAQYSQPALPEGFVFDQALGCYYNPSTQYYYDANTQLFYNSLTGVYYRFDAYTLQYIQVSIESTNSQTPSVLTTPKAEDNKSAHSSQGAGASETSDNQKSNSKSPVSESISNVSPSKEESIQLSASTPAERPSTVNRTKDETRKKDITNKSHSSLKFVIKGKKMGKDMQRWSQQQQILDKELEDEERRRGEEEKRRQEERKRSIVPVNLERFVCMLCQRKFHNEMHLKKHIDESSLHKQNLSLPLEDQEQRIIESCEKGHIPVPESMKRLIRASHNFPNKPIHKRKRPSNSDDEESRDESEPLDVGTSLLKKMGWKEGEGLGKNSSGIVKPVTASLHVERAGLGSVPIRVGDEEESAVQAGDSYQTMLRKKARLRFEEISAIAP